MYSPFSQARFLKSVAQITRLPPDTAKEVAFLGRSNAGKSSALNTITNIKRLARISKTPGRTQLINFFEVEESRYLVDLPGYGFAKAPKSVQQNWIHLINQYLRSRASLKGLILLMDIRHPLKAMDQKMLIFCAKTHLPTLVLLTKSDKLKRNPAKKNFFEVRHYLNNLSADFSLELFSSVNKEGVKTVQEQIILWLS